MLEFEEVIKKVAFIILPEPTFSRVVRFLYTNLINRSVVRCGLSYHAMLYPFFILLKAFYTNRKLHCN